MHLLHKSICLHPSAVKLASALTAAAFLVALTAVTPASASSSAILDVTGPETVPASSAEAGHVMGNAGRNAPTGATQGGVSPLNAVNSSGSGGTMRMAPLATSAYQPAATTGMPLGLDVSGYQGNVDWTAAWNSGIRFVYIKASEANSPMNDYFSQQYNGSAQAGMLRGAYHFARPNLSSGSSQARSFVNSGGGWSGDGITLPGVLDLEDNTSDDSGKCFGLSPSQLTSWTKDFTSTYKALTTRDAVIYTGYYFWQDCLQGATSFGLTNPLWIAAYGAAADDVWMPGNWPQYTFWQYTSNGAVSGISGPVDQNLFNGSYAQLQILAKGTTTAPVVVAPPATQPLTYFFRGQGGAGIQFGYTSGIPLTCDWNGDGISTLGIFSNGKWDIRNSNNAGPIDKTFYFGDPGDEPVCGDWDGDGVATPGVFRNGRVYLRNSNASGTADGAFNFGAPGDVAIAGDWNGDGYTTLAVARPEGGAKRFYLTDSNIAPSVSQSFLFGNATDSPISGDWDRDGRSTIGVKRGNVWYLANSLYSSPTVVAYGDPTDRPITGTWSIGAATGIGVAR